MTESNRHVDEIDSRFKEYSTRLKKFYGTPDQVKQVTTDLVALAVIKGSYGESKAKDEVALSKRAASLLDDGALLQRRIYASASEEIFVKNGMDVRVSAAGKNKDQLRLSYVLMSKPLVYQFQNEMKLSETARTLGFKKVIYTDGYDETWTVEL